MAVKKVPSGMRITPLEAFRAQPVPSNRFSAVVDEEIEKQVIPTRLDLVVGWIRKFSIFPYPFVTACCGMEFMSVSSNHYDTDRFGAALPKFTPRQSDLLLVVGTITHKQAPIVRRVWDQMCDPKWAIALGACAVSGGFYQNYTAVPGLDKILPVDVYIPGCPPRPETIIDAIMRLQNQIQHERQEIF